MTKSTVNTTTMFVFAGVLAMAAPARADEMQVSGTSYLNQVEAHAIPAGGNPTHVFDVEKWVGANSSPNWFGTMQFTAVSINEIEMKQGTVEAKAAIFWSNEEGSVSGSYVGKSAFRIDESIPKGGYEGTWELTSGTGRYANVRGRGTVKGEFTGTSAIDHWKGTITGFEKRASTQ